MVGIRPTKAHITLRSPNLPFRSDIFCHFNLNNGRKCPVVGQVWHFRNFYESVPVFRLKASLSSP